MSSFINGAYTLPQKLSEVINDIGANHPDIAPDDSFIIFDSERPMDTYDGSYLFFASDRIINSDIERPLTG